jgi:hypothetical protein
MFLTRTKMSSCTPILAVTTRYSMFPCLTFTDTGLKDTIVIQDRQCINNVKMRRFPKTIVTVEKQ